MRLETNPRHAQKSDTKQIAHSREPLGASSIEYITVPVVNDAHLKINLLSKFRHVSRQRKSFIVISVENHGRVTRKTCKFSESKRYAQPPYILVVL